MYGDSRARDIHRTIQNRIDSGYSAAQLLSDLIKADLGVDVNPSTLELWISAQWDSIEYLAHKIHNPRDRFYRRFGR